MSGISKYNNKFEYMGTVITHFPTYWEKSQNGGDYAEGYHIYMHKRTKVMYRLYEENMGSDFRRVTGKLVQHMGMDND